MVEPLYLEKEYADYIRSGAWICTPVPPLPPSPTGAHHWICAGGDIWVCKYCWDNRTFELRFKTELLNKKRKRRQHGDQ